MYSRMVLMVVCWLYGMPFDANGCESTPMNVGWMKWIRFCVNDSTFSGNEQQKVYCVNEFEVGVNESIFSGYEQQKVYLFTLPWLVVGQPQQLTPISAVP